MQTWEQCVREQKALHIERSLERLTDMDALIKTIDGSPNGIKLLRQLSQHFHQLAGSAGIVESADFFNCASSGEKQSGNLAKKMQGPTQRDLEYFAELVSTMRDILKSIRAGNAHTPPVSEEISAFPGIEPTGSISEGPATLNGSAQILFVGVNHASADELSAEAKKRNWSTRSVKTAGEAKQSIKDNLPDGLIIEIPLSDSAGYDVAQFLRTMPGGEKPAVMIASGKSGFLDNVQAIRSGADAYFDNLSQVKPIIDKLSYLLEKDKPQNYRILSVEDDPGWAEYICKALETAGYNVLSVSDPKEFEQALLAFDPQLVLLDIILGEMTGYELAKYLRQTDRFANLPIIFLTTQNALEDHIESARAGGDDHLVKPISPMLLVATIAGRLERYRMLQRLISRDGLTQCLTYSAFMDEAHKLISSPNMTKSLIVFDIDDIWPVNEKWGFAAGDKVIFTLSQILRKTLRPTEIIGRLGGSRFAVVLSDLQTTQLATVASYILGQFASSVTTIGENQVKCTGSAGIAACEPGMDVRSWIGKAEENLKLAKEAGGNRVAPAS
jgi:diguanylate cyclase (GGDEF)-like protein